MTTLSMSTYLSTVAPDYAYTLDIDGQHVLPHTPYKNHILLYKDDGTPHTVELDSAVKFLLSVQYTGLSADNANTIMDLWLDINKANDTARSFRWQHPKEAKIYVVNYIATPSLQLFPHSFNGIEGIQLLVRGNYVP
jgi:hypothetical protein